jgi:predicted nucleotidyltransferase
MTEVIAPVLKLEPVAVYHFGSSTADPARLRADSDIDLAFLAARPRDPYQVFQAAQEVARMAGREVDLVDLGRAGAVIRRRWSVTAAGCSPRRAADKPVPTSSNCLPLLRLRPAQRGAQRECSPPNWHADEPRHLPQQAPLAGSLPRPGGRDKYAAGRSALDDLDTLEIILLNLQRACEISIDLAMHAVASHSLGIPQDSRDAFRLLQQAGWIDEELSPADAEHGRLSATSPSTSTRTSTWMLSRRSSTNHLAGLRFGSSMC